MLPYQSVEGSWKDINHDVVRLPDLLKSRNWTNEDCKNWRGWGVRTRSGAIRQTFEEISTQLGKSTSILNRGLFGKRLESISELGAVFGPHWMDAMKVARRRMSTTHCKPSRNLETNCTLINRCRGFFNSTRSSAFDF